MKSLMTVLVGLAVLAAGCGPAIVLESGPAETVAAIPASVGLEAAGDTEYSLAATAGVDFKDGKQVMGPIIIDGVDQTFVRLGVEWYFLGAVRNDDTATALQPLAQRASSLAFSFGFGDIEDDGFDAGDTAWTIEGRYVFGEGGAEGVGFSLALGKETIDPDGGGDLEISTFEVGALYYLPGALEGLIAEVVFTDSNYDDSGDDFDMTGIVAGLEFFGEVADGQWLNARVRLGFLGCEADGAPDDDIVRLGIDLAYYPLKELGIGFAYESDSWDDYDAADTTSVGLKVTCSLDAYVPGLDLGAGWRKVSNDATPEAEESSFSLTVGYRF